MNPSVLISFVFLTIPGTYLVDTKWIFVKKTNKHNTKQINELCSQLEPNIKSYSVTSLQ